MFLERIILLLPPTHILPTTITTYIIVCALVGKVIESGEGKVFRCGLGMGPAKFEFGSDFDGARECLCAVLDYVHLCGGGNGGFAGFGNHPCGVGGLLLLCESALLGVGVVVAKLEGWLLGKGWFVVVISFVRVLGHTSKKNQNTSAA